MDRYTNWAERARSERELEEVFSGTSDAGTLFDRLFFGVCSTGVGAIGTYVELYFHQARQVVAAYILAYAAPYGDVSAELRVRVKEFPLKDPSPRAINITSPQVVGSCIYRIHILGTLNMDTNSKIVLADVRATLGKDYSAARTYACFDMNILPLKWPDRQHNVRTGGQFIRSEQVLCPNCFGNGSFLTMKVPDAVWESGATGHALWSHNEVNGRAACDVCGGSGEEYLPWYLAEHPELKNTVFVPGNGLQPE